MSRTWDRGVNVALIICLVALVSTVIYRGLISEPETETTANDAKLETDTRAQSDEAEPMLVAPIDPTTEDGRKALYMEILRIKVRVQRDVDAFFPENDARATPLGADVDKRSAKRLRQTRALEVKYLAQLAAHHGLNQEEIRAIREEGQSRNWAAEPE